VTVWAVAGGRDLGAEFAPLVAEVCALLPAVAVGCASGCDSLVLRWAVSAGAVARVQCFAAFGACGVGAVPAVSAVSAVSAFARAGGEVSWWSGGAPALPARARLAARSRAVVGAASGLIVFFSSPNSRGSLLAARAAAGRGLPVFAFACGFSPAALPSLAPGGGWRSSSRFAGAWQWQPPPSLF
jgi:predicted Rossmann fold nucleotide-binding protein DprA/Smf involved in DNA uptake